MSWFDLVGWGGSALLVVSLLQSRMTWLRILNTGGSVVLVAYNAVIGVWPMAGLNAAMIAINLFRLFRERRLERRVARTDARPDTLAVAEEQTAA